jgi:hypothetical protein
MARKTVDTELAAIYWTMLHRPNEPISLVSQQDIAKAKRVIYDLAKNKLIKNYGDQQRDQARWDIAELWRVYKSRQDG